VSDAPDESRLEALRGYLTSAPAAREPGGREALKRAARRLPGGTRTLLTRMLHPWSRRKLRAAADRSPLRLHLGSGGVNKPGWLNIDLALGRADVAWDLSTGIPFPTSSVDAIFHEHMLEHLDLPTGFAFSRECLRVLKPGGILRIAVPDAGHLLGSYAGTADRGWAESRPTPMLAVNALFYEHGHRAMYDADTLTLMLCAAGFAHATRSEFGGGDLQPSPDSRVRRDGTLYVEARKPGVTPARRRP
jgi:predicted SAM-dependent methyltransferase